VSGLDEDGQAPARRAPRVRIVCFDLGGVLVRICRTWAEGCRAAGVEERARATDEAGEAARGQLMDLFGTGRISEAEWAERLSAALLGSYTAEELKRIHHAWTLDEYAEAGRLIDELHAAGVATACLSNTNPSHWTRLIHHDGARALSGPAEYPAVQRLGRHFASHLLGLAKPDPAIYRAFEQATDLSGHQILFFDDLGENVEAARARGWNAELIDPARETVPQLRAALARYRLL
jgi:FMN phosphatase YigB (HAD superfamily)